MAYKAVDVARYFVEETYWEVKEQIMREQPLNG